MKKIPSSEITPEHIYLSRRTFMKGAVVSAAAAAITACAPANTPMPAAENPTQNADTPSASKQTDELGNQLTSYASVTSYNNYYEFARRI